MQTISGKLVLFINHEFLGFSSYGLVLLGIHVVLSHVLCVVTHTN